MNIIQDLRILVIIVFVILFSYGSFQSKLFELYMCLVGS